jgi:hypothetical protein
MVLKKQSGATDSLQKRDSFSGAKWHKYMTMISRPFINSWINKALDWAKTKRVFWKVYFWWGIRQARKRRLANEARMAARPKLTNDEFWELKHLEAEQRRREEKERNGSR